MISLKSLKKRKKRMAAYKGRCFFVKRCINKKEKGLDTVYSGFFPECKLHHVVCFPAPGTGTGDLAFTQKDSVG